MGVLAWQGWWIELPGRWNPVKLEGDFASGHALLADLHRPRLGIRWSTPRGRAFDAARWARNAMREEVGKLAAGEAKDQAMPSQDWEASLLYLEPQPPGRDVWVGYSRPSGRAIELIHHARRRERILPDSLLPRLRDISGDAPMPWAVFELSCRVPPGLRLVRQQLNAGDLSLTFRHGARALTVRQVAVAKLALKRMPLEKWLVQQQAAERKHYRPAGDPCEIELSVADRRIAGSSRSLHRRRRWFWRRGLSAELVTIALHDQERDRLVIVQGSDESLVREAAASIGWATGQVTTEG